MKWRQIDTFFFKVKAIYSTDFLLNDVKLKAYQCCLVCRLWLFFKIETGLFTIRLVFLKIDIVIIFFLPYDKSKS